MHGLRFSRTMAGVVVGLFLTCTSAMATQGVRVVDGRGPWVQWIGMDRLKAHSRTIETLDLNFRNRGKTPFSGLTLPTLLELAKIRPDRGLTIVGGDQYISYIPCAGISQGFLAWSMANHPIPPLEGGPLKIIYDGGHPAHPACYTWYVGALIVDSPSPPLTLSTPRRTRTYSRGELVPMARPLAPGLAAFPRGCRNALDSQKYLEGLLSVPLADLLMLPDLSPLKRLVCRTMSGGEMVLDPRILELDIQVVVGNGQTPLHPALGGPFSLVFPLEIPETHGGLVPGSGGVFFLVEMGAEE